MKKVTHHFLPVRTRKKTERKKSLRAPAKHELIMKSFKFNGNTITRTLPGEVSGTWWVSSKTMLAICRSAQFGSLAQSIDTFVLCGLRVYRSSVYQRHSVHVSECECDDDKFGHRDLTFFLTIVVISFLFDNIQHVVFIMSLLYFPHNLQNFHLNVD